MRIRTAALAAWAVLVAAAALVAVAAGCSDLKAAPGAPDGASGPTGGPGKSGPGKGDSSGSPDDPDDPAEDSGPPHIEDGSFVDAGRCDGGPCPPVLLAAGLGLPVDVAVDDANVYWAEYGLQNQGLEGKITRLAKEKTCIDADAGCRDTILGRPPSELFRVAYIAVAEGELCWIDFYVDQRQVSCFNLATGAKRLVSASNVGSRGLVMDGPDLVWANSGKSAAEQTGAIVHTPRKTGTSAVPAVAYVTGRPFASDVVVDPDTVFWSEAGLDGGGAVMAIARAGGATRTIGANQSAPYGVALRGAYIYWLDEKGGRIWRGPKDASSPATAIISGQKSPYDLAVDGSGVYWVARGTPPNYLDGKIMRADLDGAHVTTLDHDLHYPVTLTLDAAYVYYAMYGTQAANYADGELKRIGKR